MIIQYSMLIIMSRMIDHDLSIDQMKTLSRETSANLLLSGHPRPPRAIPPDSPTADPSYGRRKTSKRVVRGPYAWLGPHVKLTRYHTATSLPSTCVAFLGSVASNILDPTKV